MDLRQLQPNVDYFYCGECGRHVACIRLEPGLWEVQCPRCVGECGLCSCSANGICQGKDGSPVQTHMHVAGESSKGGRK